jgi:hypothetical protein
MRAVRLTWAEVLVAANIGCMRNVQDLQRELTPGNNQGFTNTWTPNIEGACGEMAVAKHLNTYWSGAIGRLRDADVGPFQVKTNMTRTTQNMCIHKVSEASIYISVLSFLPVFYIVGWIKGSDIVTRKAEWWHEKVPGRAAYFVPRPAFQLIETLPTDDFALEKGDPPDDTF